MKVVDSKDMVCPEAFSNSKYDGVFLLETKDKQTAVMLRSKSPVYLRWCIAYGTVNLFFRAYSEAEKFCKEHNIKKMERRN